MAKKSVAKRRRGLSTIAFGQKTAAARHGIEKDKTEQDFPVLKQALDDIKESFEQNRAADDLNIRSRCRRFIHSYGNGTRKQTSRNDSEIASGTLRNANMFSGIVAYCCDLGDRTKKERDRDRKSVSRWSQQLDEAFEQETPPTKLLTFLKGKVAALSQTFSDRLIE